MRSIQSSRILHHATIERPEIDELRQPTTESFDTLLKESATPQLGLDTAVTPTLDQCRSVHAAWGVSFFGVYLNGPCVFSAWDIGTVKQLLAEGFGILPYYVGQQTPRVCSRSNLIFAQGVADAGEAMAALDTYGLHGAAPCLDLEAETFNDHPDAAIAYTQGWVQAVHNRGAQAVVYGSPAFLSRLASASGPPEYVVIAAYVGQSVDANAHEPASYGLNGWTSHGQRAWQYSNQIMGAGKEWDALSSNLPIFHTGPGPAPTPTPAPAPIIDGHIVPAAPVGFRTFRSSAGWYNWGDLSPRTDHVGPGIAGFWSEAKLFQGQWYDRVMNGHSVGDWCLLDRDVDDGGFEPHHFAPPPPP